MSTSGQTTRAKIPYPLNSDNAAVAGDIQSLAQFIDANVALFVQAASQPASPIRGQIWWCTNTTAVDGNGNSQYGFNWYDGTNWFNVTEQMFMVGAMAPSPTFIGLLWYDTSTVNGNFKYWNGTAWVDIIPSTATNGQVLTSSSTGIKYVTPSYVPTTSGVSSGYVLSNASGTPTWSAISFPANTALTSPLENANIVSAAATGTLNIDAITSTFVYYNTAATGNFVINVRGNSGTALNSILSVGQSITVTLMNTNGLTPYYMTQLKIDGTNVTPQWQGAFAPGAGYASSTDTYSFMILKTASNAYKVLASLAQFA
jgi:hypothetical protein